MIMDGAKARELFGAINVSGQAAFMIPGGFQLGGASGNTPVGYDPDVLRPFLERITRGPAVYGGLVLGTMPPPDAVAGAQRSRDVAASVLATAPTVAVRPAPRITRGKVAAGALLTVAFGWLVKRLK